MEEFNRMSKQANRWGKYQKILGILMIITSSYIPIIIVVLPMNQATMDFTYNGVLYYKNITDPNSTISKDYFCNTIHPKMDYFDTIENITIAEYASRTWSSDLKFVCNSKEIFSLLGTFYFLGAISAYSSLFKIPDRFGRQYVFKTLNLFSLICLLQLLYLKTYFQLMICSFVLGMSSINMSIAAVILNENMDENYSSVIMGIANAAFPLFGLINTFFFYFFQDWRPTIYLICLNSLLLNIGCFYYLRETPVWLNANNKREQLIDTLNFIANVNNTKIEPQKLSSNNEYNELQLPINEVQNEEDNEYYYFDSENNIVETSNNIIDNFNIINNININNNNVNNGENNEKKDIKFNSHKYDLLDLLYYGSIRKITISNLFLWGVSGFSFYGIFLNIEGMTGNIYLDATVSYSAEFIAEMLSGHLAVLFGRKKVLFYSFLMAGVGSFFIRFFQGILVIQSCMIFIAAMGVASAFNVLYIYSAELLPTNIKILSLSCYSLFNRLTAGMVPIILTFTTEIVPLIGILSIISSLIMCYLPESMGYDAGNEVEEVLEIMNNSSSNIIRQRLKSNATPASSIYLRDLDKSS